MIVLHISIIIQITATHYFFKNVLQYIQVVASHFAPVQLLDVDKLQSHCELPYEYCTYQLLCAMFETKRNTSDELSLTVV